ncbi:MAG: hypothetical protein LBR86_07865 [Tannerella sp.]|jgi:hypothetical protein|nr:hypothetical protein [Tannerella sp.]
MKRILSVLFLLAYAGIADAQEVTPAVPDSPKKADTADDMQLRIAELKPDDRSNAGIHLLPAYRDYARIYEGAFSTNDRLSYRLYGTENILPGLMFIQRQGADLSLPVNEALSIHAGGYLMKYGYNFGYRPYYSGVLHLRADYRLTPWLTVGAYGQYVPLEQYNARQGSMLPSPFVPASSFGVTGTAMFNRTFGVNGTLGKEYDPRNGQWRTVYGIAPVINLNSLFK